MRRKLGFVIAFYSAIFLFALALELTSPSGRAQNPLPGGGGGGGSSSSAGAGNSLCSPVTASATAYTCAPSPAYTTYTNMVLTFVPDVTSGAAPTLAVNGLAAGVGKNLKMGDGSTAVTTGGLIAGTAYTIAYDGTSFRLVDGMLATNITSGSLPAARLPLVWGGISIDNTGASGGFTVGGNGITVGGASTFNGSASAAAGFTANTYASATNCASAAAPAVCGSAAAGSVVVAAGGTTVTVNTTAVKTNSQIFLTFDGSTTTGTRLSVTCNTTEPALYGVSAKTNATSFVITSSAPSVNPACFSYFIVN